MIFRHYLPYESARQYVDRGMAKWMGFFISEHTSALLEMGHEIDFSKQMNEEEILMLLGQVYLNHLTIALYTKDNYQPFVGQITDIENETIYFRTDGTVLPIHYTDIIRLQRLEDDA